MLDAAGLARAALESVAENTSDAHVAPVLWAAVGGVPVVLVYRGANTLDAMIGDRSSRYVRFGWAAARFDDAANFVAARLTALLVALCAPAVGGSPAGALRAWRRDAARHPSPNAGVVEAAFAGALGVRLGGLPEGVPPRVQNPPAYMSVNDAPPPRESKKLTPEERAKLEAEMAASRSQNTSQALTEKAQNLLSVLSRRQQIEDRILDHVVETPTQIDRASARGSARSDAALPADPRLADTGVRG